MTQSAYMIPGTYPKNVSNKSIQNSTCINSKYNQNHYHILQRKKEDVFDKRGKQKQYERELHHIHNEGKHREVGG